MLRRILRVVRVSVCVLAVLAAAGCASASTVDENPALTAKVQAAIAGQALTTPDDVAAVTSKSNGQVIVTLKKNSNDLTGFTGSDAAAAAAGVGNVTGDDLLARVPEATSVEVRDGDGKVLATRSRK